jgi:hypothetical protein
MAYGDWLSAHMFSYDMVGAYEKAYGVELLTDQNRTDYKAYILDYCDWYIVHLDSGLDPLFVDRDGGDYTLTALGTLVPDHSLKVYDGGPRPRTVTIRYHNRNCNGMKAIGLAAIVADDTFYKSKAKQWVKEFVMFAMSSDPWISDFERAMNPNHGQGWSYSTRVLAPAITIAEVFRAAGDPELIEYTTTEGSDQTSGNYVVTGEPKSLRTGVDLMLRYVNKQETRTYDGVALVPGDFWIHDGMFMHARRNWEHNEDWNQTWNRTYPGGSAFPSSPLNGWFTNWCGESAMFPGSLFMWGPD